MSLLLLLLIVVYAIVCHTHAEPSADFTFNGFQSTNLTLDGDAKNIQGILFLTNSTKQDIGHAFYPSPIIFKNSKQDPVISFSTSFVFGIKPLFPGLGGHGLSFVIAPQPGLPGAVANNFMGLFSLNQNSTVVAVEFDTAQSPEFNETDDNHVGIDINSPKSLVSKPAGYYLDSNGALQNLSLISEESRRVWIRYDGLKKQMNVTIAPTGMRKPDQPLLSLNKDLSPYINPIMYVGFASATGTAFNRHYLLGWSFKMNGEAKELDISLLPKLPTDGKNNSSKKMLILTIGLPLILCFVVLITVIPAVVYYVRRKKKFAEEIEDWELEYGPHRFKYKDLYFATKGFSDSEVLGTGGFGQVYKGVIPSSKMDIAVKRVSHQSRQGMREFVAEIVSIGRLRHRNLVQLLGYCRRENELLLVYEYMSNGSLDKFLYDQPGVTLNWSQRFRIIKGAAAGLLYLHEGWEQVVIHRDIKASNVLLDSELNAKLGDFGLSRLYDHGTDLRTTHVVGTIGYLAPEHTRTGKASPATDVYSFGAFLLEVASGRRPIGSKDEEFILVDWVFCVWEKGVIINAVDPNLGGVFECKEVELVMKLGLLCSNTNPSNRPTMRQVVQLLEGDIPFPELSLCGMTADALSYSHKQGFEDFSMSYPSSITGKAFSHISMDESFLSGGR